MIKYWVVLILMVSPASAVCNTSLKYFVGKSMEPTIYAGDKVFYDWSPARKITIGDIVLVRYQKYNFSINVEYRGNKPTWLVHRVHGFKDGGVVLKGDNNPYIDPVVFRRSDINGVVCRVRSAEVWG